MKDKYDDILHRAISGNINQAQYSTKEQLETLLIIGNKCGLYDAVDLIKLYINNK